MSGANPSTDHRILIYTARRRDEDLALIVLRQAGLSAEAFHSIEALCRGIEEGCGAILLGEEALSRGDVESLLEVLKVQPSWSDVPFVILTSGGRSTGHSLARSHMLERLGHITLLERPVRMVTLVASVRAALASRARQYEVRSQLAALVRQREELTRSNAALEQFAYAAAHDLQEPIRNVSLYTQFLARKVSGHLDGETRDHVGLIVEGAQRMQNLVEDLLAYTRAVNAPGQEESCVAETATALDVVLFHLRQSIEETGTRITHDPLPRIPVYEPHMVQLLQNLISNAIKYRSDCPPRIHVSAVREPDAWHMAVIDNGIGIAKEFCDRIFGVFKRLHGRDIPGNGIGLAICQRIVHHYGGRIWVTSTVGAGSEFHFTLPVVKNDDA